MHNKPKFPGRNHLSGKQKIQLLTAALSLLLWSILQCFRMSLQNSLPDQNAAARWSKNHDVAQISIFFTEDQKITEDSVKELAWKLTQALTEQAIGKDEKKSSGRELVMAYSAEGQITLNREGKTLTVNAVGVGGDFFLFHPLTLLSGQYLNTSLDMKDGIVLDEDTAWQLFGSSNIVGQTVEIGGLPFYIRGVVKKPTGRLEKAAGLSQSLVFVDYAMLQKYGSFGGGGFVPKDDSTNVAPAGDTGGNGQVARLRGILASLQEEVRLDPWVGALGEQGVLRISHSHSVVAHRESPLLVSAVTTGTASTTGTGGGAGTASATGTGSAAGSATGAATTDTASGTGATGTGGSLSTSTSDSGQASTGSTTGGSTSASGTTNDAGSAGAGTSGGSGGSSNPSVHVSPGQGGGSDSGSGGGSTPEAEPVGGINCIEILMPNPVDGFAKGLVLAQAGYDPADAKIVDNTVRFRNTALMKVIGEYGTRSMQLISIHYPYWENIARGLEEELAFIFILECLLLAYPTLVLCAFVVSLYRNKTWTTAQLVKKVQDKIYDIQARRAEKKKKNG
ncbi:MAG: ABC transporter permease [Lachnospiraceae bacterium]|nr:ABC transporter permease [Lachnospiraceae bacterium]